MSHVVRLRHRDVADIVTFMETDALTTSELRDFWMLAEDQLTVALATGDAGAMIDANYRVRKLSTAYMDRLQAENDAIRADIAAMKDSTT